MDVKNALKKFEGNTFYTITGLPFSYNFVSENYIKPDRTNRIISLSNIESALKIAPQKPTDLPKSFHGPSYIFGIVSDPEFLNYLKG